MKQRVRKFVIRLLLCIAKDCIGLSERLLPPEPESPPTPPTPEAVFALERITFWAPRDASGEFKRHQVYTELIRQFPSQRRRDLALLLEQVYQDFNG